MTSAITYATIESNAYDNVVSYLNNRTIIVDPKDKGGYSKRLFVYDVDPLMKSLTFEGLPYIIAEHPMLEYSKVSADGKSKDITWRMNITIRTARDGSGQGTSGVGKVDLFAIGDDLQALFNSTTHRQAFKLLNMDFMDLKKIGVSSPVVSEKYLYEADYELSFMTRMVITA